MAATYYVDIGTIAAWDTRAGTASGTCWYGMSGLQNAFDVAVVTDIVYIKGTGDLSKFYSVAYDADNDTSLTNGEECTWGLDATHGHGIVHIISTTATSPGTVEIELLSGVAPANDLDITGVTSGGVITPTATIAQKTLDLDTNGGTNAAGFIKYIGTNSSFAVDGTRAIIDANSVAVNILTLAAAVDLLWFENIEVQEAGASKDVVIFAAANTDGCVFINCCAHNCGSDGFDILYARYALFIRCVAYSNTGHGYKMGGASNKCLFCCSRDNAGDGFAGPTTSEVIIGCVAHGNTDDGIDQIMGLVMNCVVDGNSDNGIEVFGHTQFLSTTVIGCRITNHSGAGDIGLNCNSEVCITGWNYFENNADDNIQNVTLHYPIPVENGTTTTNLEDLSNTDYGYVNSAGHDFSTGYTDSGDPDLRRVAITVPWS